MVAHQAPVGILFTDTQVEPPGPTIVYANEAFASLTGRTVEEVIGISPRFMQGRETRRPTLDLFARALSAGERFHGHLTNYRADGAKYVAEIDCRPLRGADGGVEYFVSFEREVVRRRGRPWPGSKGRFEPVSVSNASLSGNLELLSLFSPTPSA